MNGSWPQVPLGELLTEQKVRTGVFDADGLPLLGVSNTLGLHRTEKPRIPDMSRYLRVSHGWFAYNPMRIMLARSVGQSVMSRLGLLAQTMSFFPAQTAFNLNCCIYSYAALLV